MSSPTFLLAIDTCTRRTSIALRNTHTLCAEMTWDCERQHTAEISENIQMLFRTSQVTPSQVGAVGVAIGPGSFTGVRCGLAIAKGFATANSIPIIGVTSFDAIALAQPKTRKPIYAVVALGRTRLAACRYEWLGSEPTVTNDWQAYSHAQFLDAIEPNAHLCGDIPPDMHTLIQTSMTIAPTWLNLRRAGVLAELAHARWQRNETDNADTLAPLYPPEN